MKCREFEKHLPDWQGGRLSEEWAARMEAHRRLCPVCNRAAQSEQHGKQTIGGAVENAHDSSLDRSSSIDRCRTTSSSRRLGCAGSGVLRGTTMM